MTAPADRRERVATIPRPRRRALFALLVVGLSGLGNFLVAVTVARLESASGLGQFALAFSFYVLGSGLARSMVTDTVLAAGDGAASAAGRVSLLGVAGGILLCGVGLAHDLGYLTLAGLALPGLVIYDYTKAIAVGIGAPRAALSQEAAWAVLTVVVVVPGLLRLVDAPVVFGVWALGGAAIGVVVATRRRYAVLPAWRAGRDETRVAAGFGAQFLLTTGSAQLALTGVAAFAGTAVVGALSAGRTLLGPANLVHSTAATLMVPHLARTRAESRSVRTRAAGRIVLLVVAGLLPMTVAVALLPDSIGTTLLGANWTLARELLPLLALESLLAVPAAVGFAGLRIERASRRAVTLGLVLGVLRVPVVVAGAVLFGATGAAGALVVLALVSAVAWAGSYLLLLGAGTRTAPPRGPADPVTATTAQPRRGRVTARRG
ncbi:MATE family efflux transporter [Micromonospora palythoicola]|uniref:hypothetical protein n=1 Tax=Micromonospora palythoicola TaxID=3120507 RepID=UPI002FCE49C1